MSDPTQRFTNRVDHYVRYRPYYPHSVLDLLETECGLTSTSFAGSVITVIVAVIAAQVVVPAVVASVVTPVI